MFAFTGDVQTWTVPAGVTSASFDVAGGQGGFGHDSNQLGGLGGEMIATLPVTAGQTLQVDVGGWGSDGVAGAGGFNGGAAAGGFAFYDGGGGGGASDIRQGLYGLGDRLIVAGGGGGSGFDGGGTGGDTTGGPGTTHSNIFGDGGGGGGGGTQSAGGAHGAASGAGAAAGTDGVLGAGGAGGDGNAGGAAAAGGGGGGGYYGGGGGGGTDEGVDFGGGGGGGSGYFDPSATSKTNISGVRSGDGLVTISYTLPGLTGQDGSSHNAVEGAALIAATLGTFTDPDTSAVASDFSATACWNDAGTPPPTNDCGAVTVTGGNGSFTVTAGHTFGEEGSYNVNTTVTLTGTTVSTTLNMPVVVADAALTATGVKATMNANKTQTKVVGNFKDADPAGTTSDYSATISWGDATASTGGLVAPNGLGGWSVGGSHKYAKPGAGYSVTVTIHDSGGAQTSTVSVIKVNK